MWKSFSDFVTPARNLSKSNEFWKNQCNFNCIIQKRICNNLYPNFSKKLFQKSESNLSMRTVCSSIIVHFMQNTSQLRKRTRNAINKNVFCFTHVKGRNKPLVASLPPCRFFVATFLFVKNFISLAHATLPSQNAYVKCYKQLDFPSKEAQARSNLCLTLINI